MPSARFFDDYFERMMNCSRVLLRSRQCDFDKLSLSLVNRILANLFWKMVVTRFTCAVTRLSIVFVSHSCIF